MKQLNLFSKEENSLLNLKDASAWASQYLNRKITTANISYLLQYGRVNRYKRNGTFLVNIDELKKYYNSFNKEIEWKKKIGKDLNWQLSFSQYKESERTKHVHRLHPYKGKFIPQLVEYFIDTHTDNFKKEIYFQLGDIILDPFCGSGTTLIQANEQGINAIGIDVSEFNAMISNVKIKKYDVKKVLDEIQNITINYKKYQKTANNILFEKILMSKLSEFNYKYFPSPEYKKKIRSGIINETSYGKEKERDFLKIYENLIKKYKIKIKQNKNDKFLDIWFLLPIRNEIDFISNEINKIKDKETQKILQIILSRTVRSCRATTHADLGTLKEPILNTYYCRKHGKICKPLFSINNWWQRYCMDTINRIKEFDKIRTETFQICLTGDSRTIDIYKDIKKTNSSFGKQLVKQKIKGIFSSPPYVGVIDYHEQHAYAYEIFNFNRKDDLEIGPLSNGQARKAREKYIADIAAVLNNCKKYLQKNYDVFLVANDKYNLYPEIAKLSGMKIVNKFVRPVLNRVEKDRANAYSEIIFHLKEI